jgi:exodeoxyribonuclease V gamma subunit
MNAAKVGHGLTLTRSNRVEKLFEAWLAVRSQRTTLDPFAAEVILVQGTGMRDWMQRHLADREGIAMHLHFVYPDELARWVRSLRTGSTEPVEAGSPWTPERMVWSVLDVLRVWDPAGRDPLALYLQARGQDASDPDLTPDRRRFGLATELTALLRRYLIWRPDMIWQWSHAGPGEERVWTRTGPQPLPKEARWQTVLWREVLQRAGGPDAIPVIPSRGVPDFLPAAVDGVDLPAHVTLFGVHHLNPEQRNALSWLRERMRLDWYMLAPTPLFLGDQDAKSLYLGEPFRKFLAEPVGGDGAAFDQLEGACPLVVHFGRVSRTAQLDLESDGYLQPEEPAPAAWFVHPIGDTDRPATVLQRLQADAWALEALAYSPGGHRAWPLDESEALRDARTRRTIDPDDLSLSFHSCYGPQRQVEAVRDLIVELLERDPTLQPRDIAVLTPDIATFAPLVEAVFSELQGDDVRAAQRPGRVGIPRIPFRIRDRAIRSTNPVARVLILLLQMGAGRASMTQVVELLNQWPMQRAWGLDAGDVAQVEDHLRRAGARWGLDARHRATQDAPTSIRFTLHEAIDRIALGVAMDRGAVLDGPPTEEAGVDPGRLPMEEAGGWDLAGRAVLLFDALLGAVDAMAAPRSPAGWRDLILSTDPASPGLLARFAHVPAGAAWLLGQIRDELEALQSAPAPADGGPGVHVDAGVMARWMEDRLNRTDRLTDDGINAALFCSLMPLRSVPARHLILLGVDEASFPRRGSRPAWDLMALAPLLNDSNPRDDDRHVMLDALLSARDGLHVVWTGRQAVNNAAVPPAAPVAELLDLLDRRFDGCGPEAVRPSCWFLCEWPLQSFSASLFHRLADEGERGQAWRPVSRHAGQRDVAMALAGRGPGQDPSGQRWCLSPGPDFRLDRAAGPEFQVLALEGIAQRLRKPVHHFVKQHLRLLEESDQQFSDQIPISMDSLDSYMLQEEALSWPLDGDAWAERRRALLLDPRVPVGRLGELQVDRIHAMAHALRASQDDLGWTPDPDVEQVSRLEIDPRSWPEGIGAMPRVVLESRRMTCGTMVLNGKPTPIRLAYRPGKVGGSHLLLPVMEWLMDLALDLPRTLVMQGVEKDRRVVMKVLPGLQNEGTPWWSPAEAQRALAGLAAMFLEADVRMVHTSPYVGVACASAWWAKRQRHEDSHAVLLEAGWSGDVALDKSPDGEAMKAALEQLTKEVIPQDFGGFHELLEDPILVRVWGLADESLLYCPVVPASLSDCPPGTRQYLLDSLRIYAMCAWAEKCAKKLTREVKVEGRA